jgi:hypothetical protein
LQIEIVNIPIPPQLSRTFLIFFQKAFLPPPFDFPAAKHHMFIWTRHLCQENNKTQNPRLVLYEVARWTVPCQKSARTAVNALAGVSTQAEPD